MGGFVIKIFLVTLAVATSAARPDIEDLQRRRLELLDYCERTVNYVDPKTLVDEGVEVFPKEWFPNVTCSISTRKPHPLHGEIEPEMCYSYNENGCRTIVKPFYLNVRNGRDSCWQRVRFLRAAGCQCDLSFHYSNGMIGV